MLELLKDETVDTIYFGGAVGVDTYALASCIGKRTRPSGLFFGPRLVVVCPDTLEQQPPLARNWAKYADEVVELGCPITARDGYKSYRDRNIFMVDRAAETGGFLVAFWNGLPKGGTYHTIQYAQTVGVPIVVFSVGEDS